MDNLTREMRLCEKAGFGVSYGKWKATQPVKEMPKQEDTRTCLYCGKPLISSKYGRGKKYCGMECSHAAWHGRKDAKERRTSKKRIPAYSIEYGNYEEEVEKKCEWCGRMFMAKRKNKRYCQNNCAALASYYRRKDAENEAKKAGHD